MPRKAFTTGMDLARPDPPRWEYRFFNVDDGRAMETLTRMGGDGWEAFSLENYKSFTGAPMTRIYAKRAVHP
jgi:hypothetical protein